MGSTDYNSGLDDFEESYDFFSVGIYQKRFAGLRQSSEVSRKWGAHTKELGVRTACGLTLGVEQPQANRYTKQVDLLEDM